MAKKTVSTTAAPKKAKTVKDRLAGAQNAPAATAAPEPSKDKKKVTKPRKAHATRGVGAEEIKILERQNLVMDLKTAGTSFRKILKHLTEQKGYDVSLATVHADYVASLERLQETNVNKTELLVLQELEKIEEWEFFLTTATRGKTLKVFEVGIAVGAFAQLQNQRDKFLGLSKPKVIKLQTDADFAKALGIKPEDLPNVDESDDE